MTLHFVNRLFSAGAKLQFCVYGWSVQLHGRYRRGNGRGMEVSQVPGPRRQACTTGDEGDAGGGGGPSGR